MFQGTGALAFNAAFYLQTNPDVFQAIQNGTFQGSALDHFVQFGQFEGRDPNAFFDTEYYLANNTDVLVAIADPANPSVTSAFQHFVMFGSEEGVVRAPSAQFEGFTEAAYLAANPDVAAAVAAGQFANGFEHFLTFGVNEVRAGSGVTVDPNPGVPGATLSFTVDVDQLTGTANNDTFTGVVGGPGASFQAGDQADGAGGVDRLNLTAVAAATVSGTILNNIEQVYTRALADTTLDATLWTGVDQLWNDRSTAGSDVTYTGVQEAATLGLNNTTSALAVTFADGAFETKDTLNLVTNNSTSTVTVTAPGTTFTGVSIAATGANVLTAAAAAAATTLTVSGSGSLEITNELTAATTVDASANTGGVDLDFTGSKEAVTVTGGAGDDRFDFGVGLTKTDVVDGGEGFNTVVVDAATTGGFASVAGAAPFNALTNIDRVEFDGTGAVTLQGNTFTNAGITNLLFNNVGDVTILNAGSARTYEFGADSTGAATFELKSAATTLNVDLLGDEGTATTGADVGGITVAYAAGTPATAVTTLNLSSVGELAATASNSTGTITLREGSTIVIDGDADLDIAGLIAATAPAGATAEGFTIDASAFTGDLTFTASAVQEDITLGAGQDTVNFVVGSSGDIDTSGLTPVLVDIDVITGFTAGEEGDILSFAGGTTGAYDALTAAELASIEANSATLLDAANNAAAVTDAGDWSAFTFQGETYAIFNAAGTTFDDAADVLVQLSGVAVADLTVDNFTA